MAICMRERKATVLALWSLCVWALLSFPIDAMADEWFPPKVETYYSQNHRMRFTVTPRDISSPLAYFDGKVKGEKLAGQLPNSAKTFAKGLLEQQDNTGRWTTIWDHQLVNDVSPVSAVVSNSGRYVATFDNWHSMGGGNDAVVIYGPNASVVRALSLRDILPDYYVEALPRSVSSIWWSGEHHVAEPRDTLILRVVVPSEHDNVNSKRYVDLPLLLATGEVRSPMSGQWQWALTQAASVAKAKREAEKSHDLWFRSPLIGPKNSSESDWQTYLMEAFFRLDANWKDDFPWKTILRSPVDKDYADSEAWIREDLDGTGGYGGTMMIASPASPDNLIRFLQSTVRGLKKGTLKGRRVYVCVPAAYRDRAEEALKATGATFVFLDPNAPIPQRKERLEAYH